MSAFAIISDIHANLEALDAVLADIARRGIVSIYCLGDVLGYGPNPLECLDRALDWHLTLLGNHDLAAMFAPDGFGASAERAIFWTRARLESPDEPRAARERRWDFLAERPCVRAKWRRRRRLGVLRADRGSRLLAVRRAQNDHQRRERRPAARRRLARVLRHGRRVGRNWHRVPYDVDATVAKIYDVPDLDNILGDRLREGR